VIVFRIAVTLVLALLFAGCSQGIAEHQFGGSFTEAATQNDIQDFRTRMEKHGATDVLILESFPAQFVVRGLTTNCEAARSEAGSLAYVRSVNDCRKTVTSSNGDAPTATSHASDG
jgi:hypothetical protein